MRFLRQEYWSGLPFPSPGNLPDAAIEPVFPASLTLAGRFFTTETPGKPLVTHIYESILQRKHQTQVMESKKMFFSKPGSCLLYKLAHLQDITSSIIVVIKPLSYKNVYLGE